MTWFTVKFGGYCKECGAEVFPEERAVHTKRALYCKECGEDAEGQPDSGEKG